MSQRWVLSCRVHTNPLVMLKQFFFVGHIVCYNIQILRTQLINCEKYENMPTWTGKICVPPTPIKAANRFPHHVAPGYVLRSSIWKHVQWVHHRTVSHHIGRSGHFSSSLWWSQQYRNIKCLGVEAIAWIFWGNYVPLMNGCNNSLHCL